MSQVIILEYLGRQMTICIKDPKWPLTEQSNNGVNIFELMSVKCRPFYVKSSTALNRSIAKVRQSNDLNCSILKRFVMLLNGFLTNLGRHMNKSNSKPKRTP